MVCKESSPLLTTSPSAGRDETRGHEPAGACAAGLRARRPLGSAAYGDAYLATHLALRRDVVVVEIPRAAFGGPRGPRAAPARRADPGRHHGRADDPGSSTIDARGDPVSVVTEHVPGTTLADLLDAGPLPAEQAIPILEDVADGPPGDGLAGAGARLGGRRARRRAARRSGPPRRLRRVAARCPPTSPTSGRTPTTSRCWPTAPSPGARRRSPPTTRWPPLPWRAAEVLLASLTDRPTGAARCRMTWSRSCASILVRGLDRLTSAGTASHRRPEPVAAPAPTPEPEPEPDDDSPWVVDCRRDWFRWICIALGLIVTGRCGCRRRVPARALADGRRRSRGARHLRGEQARRRPSAAPTPTCASSPRSRPTASPAS